MPRLYGFDHFLFPIEVEEGANDLFLSDGGLLEGDVSIPPGVYYAHDSEALENLGFPSLYRTIVAEAADQISLPVTIRADTPTESPDREGAGLRFYDEDNDPATFSVQFFGAGYIPPAVLGFAGTGKTASGPVVSDYHRWGVWRPWRRANRKFRNEVAELFESDGRGPAFVVTDWGTDQIRAFEYDRIPAAFVRPGRAQDDAHAERAQVGAGDEGNLFRDLWYHGIRPKEPVLVFHDLAEDSGFLSPSPTQNFEVLRSARGSRFAQELEECLTLESDGEMYTIAFAMRVDQSGGYIQG